MFSANQKKLLVVVIIIVLAAIGAAVYRMKVVNKAVPITTPGTIKAPEVKHDIVSQDKLPSGLPQDLPYETDQYAVANEVTNYGNGAEVQNVRTYYSQKTLDENYKIFTDYFNTHNWAIKATTSLPTLKSIFAVNSEKTTSISVNISKNDLTKDISVSIVSVPLK